MIDIASERLMTLTEAAAFRPANRQGKPTHISTVYRWINPGVRGVRLEAIRLGGKLYTSKEALQRFAERLTMQPAEAGAVPTSGSGGSRARARREADRFLDRVGV
jgi:hypothetical protein